MIYIPRHREIELPIHRLRVAGEFTLKVYGRDKKLRRQIGPFPNLVLNGGLDRFAQVGSSSDIVTGIVVGTGNATPTNADTQLQALVAGTTSFVTSSGSAANTGARYSSYSATYRFAEGVAAGNLAEVGARGASNTSLFSRALIVDGGGSPTTLTILSDEFLDVTYTYRRYLPETDGTGSVDISGPDYDWTSRAGQFSSWASTDFGFSGSTLSTTGYAGALTALGIAPTGSSAAGASLSPAAYTPGNYYLDFSGVQGLTNMNVSGGTINSMELSLNRLGSINVGFSPGIAKDGTKLLALGFRISWDRKSI